MSEPEYKDLVEFIREHELHRAQCGDKDQAKQTLFSIAKELEQDSLDGVYKRWLMEVLREIAGLSDTTEADKVLLLRGWKGKNFRDEEKTQKRNYRIWHTMNIMKTGQPDLTLRSASAVLESEGEFQDLSDSAIRKAYREYLKISGLPNVFKKSPK